MAKYSKEKLDKIFYKGKPIKGKNPETHRSDIYGNIMFKNSYGKNSSMAWDVDHSKPVSKGGTNHLNNLQPLNPTANKKKSNKY